MNKEEKEIKKFIPLLDRIDASLYPQCYEQILLCMKELKKKKQNRYCGKQGFQDVVLWSDVNKILRRVKKK